MAQRFLDATSQYVRRNGVTDIGAETLASVFGIPREAFGMEDAKKIAKMFEEQYGLIAGAQFSFNPNAKEKSIVVYVAKDRRMFGMASRDFM